MNCLVVGYGSIGARHASVLQSMGHDVSIVSSRSPGSFKRFESIEGALGSATFDYVVISNRTCDHYETFTDLVRCQYQGLLLIEKPLFDHVRDLPACDLSHVFVAYNLRHHPVVQDIRAISRGRKLLSIQVYVGQHLPSWRPGRDYRQCYSASRSAGGGVLRDLSHELDYVNWISGGWLGVTGVGGKFSDLEIDSDDVYCLLIEAERCAAVCLQVNYLDRNPRREIIVNMEGTSLRADLVRNTLEINQDRREYKLDKDDTYRSQHQALLDGERDCLCSFAEGMDVLELIESAEEACARRVWIHR